MLCEVKSLMSPLQLPPHHPNSHTPLPLYPIQSCQYPIFLAHYQEQVRQDHSGNFSMVFPCGLLDTIVGIPHRKDGESQIILLRWCAVIVYYYIRNPGQKACLYCLFDICAGTNLGDLGFYQKIRYSFPHLVKKLINFHTDGHAKIKMFMVDGHN